MLSSALDLKNGVKFFLERLNSEEPNTFVDMRDGCGLFYEKYVNWGLETSVIGASCRSSLILSMIYFCFKDYMVLHTQHFKISQKYQLIFF